jgi:hypothetical protein
VALALLVCSPSGAAEEPSVVVLRSGGVLHGQVSVSGERYVVTRPNSVVDVPAPQVLLVARSMDDAYERQRQQLQRDTPEAHLALAEWCLRYDLVAPAKQELSDARRLDPRDPRTAILERRLAVVIESKKSPSTIKPSKPHDDNTSKEELRKLDAIAEELPPGVVERFTRKVQPLIVNSCTASGCHQAGGKQEFQLDRAVLHGLSNRRITLRNLVAALELVDRDDPQDSELLSIPRRAHGGMGRPIFGTRQETQLAQLADWVALVSETSAAQQPATIMPEPNAAPLRPSDPFGLRAEEAPSHFLDRSVTQANFDDPHKPLRKKGAVKFGADLRPWQPKDEFDPEAFNRLARKKAESEATSAVGPTAAK